MKKNIYVSADWKESFDRHSWDKEVVDRIRKWSIDLRYSADFHYTDDVHNSVIDDDGCRRCNIKEECGCYIRRSSLVIFVVGDKTRTKKAGRCNGLSCFPVNKNILSPCNNYKEIKLKDMSYLHYEISTAIEEKKKILLVYNSVYQNESWIPSWYNKYYENELDRIPFWTNRDHTSDCYQSVKKYLI